MNIPEILRDLSEITKSLDSAQQNVDDARCLVREIQLEMALMTMRVEEIMDKARLN